MRTEYPRHLSGFDYVGRHRYFLTFCCDRRAKLFTDAEDVDLVMSQFLRAAADEKMAIVACCFMPDHVHLVTEGTDGASDLRQFLASAKQRSGYHYKSVHRRRLWQRYSHERVLRNNEATERVVAYVLENPLRAGLVSEIQDYPFFRSSVYTREQLIEYAYARPGASSG